MHSIKCNTNCSSVQLSCDGVSETKSTSTSLDVYSIKFNGCRSIYPVTILKPICKNEINTNTILQSIINDIHHCSLTLDKFIGDNPKRALARNCLSHSSSYACEYCCARAALFRPQGYVSAASRKKIFMEDVKKIDAQLNEIKNKEQSTTSDKNTLKLLEKMKHDINVRQKTVRQTSSFKTVWPANTDNAEIRKKK